MCSIGEDDFGDEGGLHAMIPEPILNKQESASTKCKKCKKNDAEYKLRFRDAECRDCFLFYVRHKFRGALGSSKILPKNSNVLFLFDGSAEAIVMLDMLHYAQTQNNFKRLHCYLSVLYIDDYALHHSDFNKADHQKYIKEVAECLQDHGDIFECYVVPIGGPLDEPQYVHFKEIDNYLENFSSRVKFSESVDQIKSLTSKQDFIKTCRNQLITKVAELLNCSFVMLSDISSTLANDLLTGIALGRGGSVALDVALVDDRYSNNVKIIRPIKELTMEEINLYLQAQNLTPLQRIQYGLNELATASLQNLTRSFVENLKEKFPSTVLTVFRTGDKIADNKTLGQQMTDLTIHENNTTEKKDECEICALCSSKLDVTHSTMLFALEFSRLASRAGTSSDSYLGLDKDAFRNVYSIDSNNLFRLCHSCRNIQKDSSRDIISF